LIAMAAGDDVPIHDCTQWIMAAICFLCTSNLAGIPYGMSLYDREPFQIRSELAPKAEAEIFSGGLIPELKTALRDEYRDVPGLEDGERTRPVPAGSDGSWHLKLSFLQEGPGKFQKDLIPSDLKADDPYLMMRSLRSLLQGSPDQYMLKSLGGVFMPMIHFGIEF
jgi:hypothetical protein